MKASDLSLKDLEYVLAVAQHQNFSRAAEACHVSQPALSKQIAHIERLLNSLLFERTKRHVLLTDHGQQFVNQAQVIMDEAQKLLTGTRGADQPLSGVFRLGIIASVCPYLLPRFIGPVKTAYPQLQLTIKESLTDNLIIDLSRGSLDFFIAARTFEQEAFDAIPLYFEPFLLAYNPQAGYRFNKTVLPQDINPQQLLLLEDGHCLKEQTLALCTIDPRDINNRFKAMGLETLLQMTSAGLGVSIIPQLAVPPTPKTLDKADDTLRFAPFTCANEGRDIMLYFRKTSPDGENFRLLAQLIQQCLPPTVDIKRLVG